MTFGFTGTSHGPLATRQLQMPRQLLWKVDVLHLGDCIHADAQANVEALVLGIKTIGHPPIEGAKRACCEYDGVREPKSYLVRNQDIATEGIDGLIACPGGWVEIQRSGTWATVRYARKLHRFIQIILPDGRVIVEGAPL